jgi:hypothetical protein
LAKEDPKSFDKIICTMALLVLEILSVRRMVGGVDEKASHIRYLRAVGIFSAAVGSFLLFIAAVR